VGFKNIKEGRKKGRIIGCDGKLPGQRRSASNVKKEIVAENIQ
jgi:hypothetical protein